MRTHILRNRTDDVGTLDVAIGIANQHLVVLIVMGLYACLLSGCG